MLCSLKFLDNISFFMNILMNDCSITQGVYIDMYCSFAFGFSKWTKFHLSKAFRIERCERQMWWLVPRWARGGGLLHPECLQRWAADRKEEDRGRARRFIAKEFIIPGGGSSGSCWQVTRCRPEYVLELQTNLREGWRLTITEKAPTTAFWLKAPTINFTFKTLFDYMISRHGTPMQRS